MRESAPLIISASSYVNLKRVAGTVSQLQLDVGWISFGCGIWVVSFSYQNSDDFGVRLAAELDRVWLLLLFLSSCVCVCVSGWEGKGEGEGSACL